MSVRKLRKARSKSTAPTKSRRNHNTNSKINNNSRHNASIMNTPSMKMTNPTMLKKKSTWAPKAMATKHECLHYCEKDNTKCCYCNTPPMNELIAQCTDDSDFSVMFANIRSEYCAICSAASSPVLLLANVQPSLSTTSPTASTNININNFNCNNNDIDDDCIDDKGRSSLKTSASYPPRTYASFGNLQSTSMYRYVNKNDNYDEIDDPNEQRNSSDMIRQEVEMFDLEDITKVSCYNNRVEVKAEINTNRPPTKHEQRMNARAKAIQHKKQRIKEQQTEKELQQAIEQKRAARREHRKLKKQRQRLTKNQIAHKQNIANTSSQSKIAPPVNNVDDTSKSNETIYNNDDLYDDITPNTSQTYKELDVQKQQQQLRAVVVEEDDEERCFQQASALTTNSIPALATNNNNLATANNNNKNNNKTSNNAVANNDTTRSLARVPLASASSQQIPTMWPKCLHCKEKPAVMAFIACGHLVYCTRDAATVPEISFCDASNTTFNVRCPFCKQLSTKLLRIYVPDAIIG